MILLVILFISFIPLPVLYYKELFLETASVIL